MPIYSQSRTVDDLLVDVLRKVEAMGPDQKPNIEDMEIARVQFNYRLNELSTTGNKTYLTSNRQHVFSSSTNVLESGVYYRTIKSFTSPTITTHATTTAYAEGANVVPSVYNGYYYQAKNAGTSSGAAPTFPAIQNDTVTDNDITWVAIPDTKPGAGANWRTFFIQDNNQSTGSSYASNTSYHRAGDFNLKDDELKILKCFIRLNGTDTPVEIISDSTFSDVSNKSSTGTPTQIHIEPIGTTNRARVYPSPTVVGADGGILHYTAILRAEVYTGSTVLNIPDVDHDILVLSTAVSLVAGNDFSLPTRKVATLNELLKKAEGISRSMNIVQVNSVSQNQITYVY